MPKKLTTDIFIERATAIHGDKYDYSLTEYFGRKTKLLVICRVHGAFYIRPDRHLYGGGCVKCIIVRRTKPFDIFLGQCYEVHGDRYDYSMSEYIGTNDKITIICRLHGKFFQTPYEHLRGRGCRKCGTAISSASIRKDTAYFIDTCSKVHNNKYDYSKSIYTGMNEKISIICPIHGIFNQLAHAHCLGRGCAKCGIMNSRPNRMTIDGFLEKAQNVHGNKYDYSLVSYQSYNDKVVIICRKHGEFNQRPSIHLTGAGCPKCSKIISKLEIEWLDYIGVPEEYRQQKRKINGKLYKMYACIDDTKTVYEFYGDFWHGNPGIFDPNDENGANHKLFRDLYEKTISKEEELKSHGYNIVSIWENDWKQIKKSLQHS